MIIDKTLLLNSENVNIQKVTTKSLPDSIATVWTSTYYHFRIHIKLDCLHSTFLLMTLQDMFSLTCYIIK